MESCMCPSETHFHLNKKSSFLSLEALSTGNFKVQSDCIRHHTRTQELQFQGLCEKGNNSMAFS